MLFGFNLALLAGRKIYFQSDPSTIPRQRCCQLTSSLFQLHYAFPPILPNPPSNPFLAHPHLSSHFAAQPPRKRDKRNECTGAVETVCPSVPWLLGQTRTAAGASATRGVRSDRLRVTETESVAGGGCAGHVRRV
ncbi:unnamed protein product [Protopolystoma xenopodis]|uniref:Uncharacterized protein n=1 Tax=Protopolystoma xenopodis TaxID=117903 RepID=A0A3S5FCS7_9PLAT|nr:unnamed protein product [Protopolystoma xenopodis]